MQVLVGDGNYVHLKIFRSLTQEISLSNYQLNKSENDEIEFWSENISTLFGIVSCVVYVDAQIIVYIIINSLTLI